MVDNLTVIKPTDYHAAIDAIIIKVTIIEKYS